jgi:two-component system LytT family sensor kinase
MAVNRQGARWRRWGVAFLIWTLLGLLGFLESVLWLTSRGEPVDWGRLLFSRMVDWYSCAIFTPICFWLVRRHPIDRQHWLGRGLLYLGCTIVIVFIKYAIYVPVVNLVEVPAHVMDFGRVLFKSFIPEILCFWCLLLAVHAIEFYRRYREREVQAARLLAQLTAAQLEALTAQLHPHFLFNTLHGISTLMHRDVEAADTMLSRLSELLRRTLHRGDRQEVPLKEELDVLSLYIGIVQARFADRLHIETHVPAETTDALVPHLMLQPLVENAVEHGIGRRPGAGRIEIRAEQVNGTLRISVSDDGAGINGDPPFPAEGIGLSNTRRRLEQLYGDAHQLELRNRAEGGLTVALTIPFRLESPS